MYEKKANGRKEKVRAEWTYVHEMCDVLYVYLYVRVVYRRMSIMIPFESKHSWARCINIYALLEDSLTPPPLGCETPKGMGRGKRVMRYETGKKYHLDIYIVSINITIIAKHLNNIHSELSYDVTIINIKTTLYILSFGFAQYCSSPCSGRQQRRRRRCRALLFLSSTVFELLVFCHFSPFTFFSLVCRCCWGLALHTRFLAIVAIFCALARKHHHTHIHICGCD